MTGVSSGTLGACAWAAPAPPARAAQAVIANQLQGNAGGEITTCEPPRRLAATWEYGGDVSWVEVRLSAAPDGTRLALEHTARPTP